jgi:hypothetical protein
MHTFPPEKLPPSQTVVQARHAAGLRLTWVLLLQAPHVHPEKLLQNLLAAAVPQHLSSADPPNTG